MNPIAIGIAVVVAIALAGCHKSSTEAPQASPQTVSQTPQQVFGLDPSWELALRATYRASQTSGLVSIKATGENPTAGYEMKLVQSPLRIWPPQYMLACKKPEGMAAQVITPFEVSTSFNAADPVQEIVVQDGAGRHQIKVEQD